MANANDPAFPSPNNVNLNDVSDRYGDISSEGGLTKREFFAAVAMQGFCANSTISESATNLDLGAKDVAPIFAMTAVTIADALLAELAKAEVRK